MDPISGVPRRDRDRWPPPRTGRRLALAGIRIFVLAGRGRPAFRPGNRCDEAIAPARQGFNVSRCGRTVAHDRAQLTDGDVQAVFEIDKGIVGPEPLVQLFARDQFAGPFQEHLEQIDRLSLEFQSGAVFAQFPAAEVQLK